MTGRGPTKLTIVVPPALSDDAPNLVDALASVLTEITLTAADGVLVALAQRYAEEIEHARDLRDESDRLMRRAIDDGADGLYEQIKRLRRRIELAETVTKIGPLLNKALEDLLATPAARAKGGIKASPTAAGRMEQLRSAVVGGA